MSPIVRYPSLACIGLALAAIVALPRGSAEPAAPVGYEVEEGQLSFETAELERNLAAVAANPSVTADPTKPAKAQKVVIRTGDHANHHQH